MKGTVVGFDAKASAGMIEDVRGAQFPFGCDQWVGDQAIEPGADVNFQPKGSKKGPFASQIVPVQSNHKEKTGEAV
jgi:cold shock CspA family protein